MDETPSSKSLSSGRMRTLRFACASRVQTLSVTECVPIQNDAVVVHFSPSGAPMYAHEKIALSAVARAIANLLQCELVDHRKHPPVPAQSLYFVPNDTLVATEASGLGIRAAADLFGGVVPHLFAKTKAVTHQLVTSRAERPEGWQEAFSARVRHVVLPGYTAFNIEDARIAAKRLFARGAIRLKDPLGDGGTGQATVGSPRDLDEFLDNYAADHMAAHGLVLERNLGASVTLSIGHVTVGHRMITYYGTQRRVINNAGQPVYGGSHLVCVRGGWEALEDLPMRPKLRLAVAQARSYDLATTEFPGFFASRRNYDVGQGYDDDGQWRSGVFEASWRSGGASTAELAALTEFARDPALTLVEASSMKMFGRECEAPAGSVIHFQGDDPDDGPLLRYTVVTRELRAAA